MLTDISDNMCEYVESVGSGCPPPKANIGILPTVDGILQCPTCFYMNASFNENVYSVEIADQTGATMVETGEIFNNVGKYCIRPKIDKWGEPYWPNGFQAGQTYTIKLKVWNECGDSHENELTFVLPPPCDVFVLESPSPSKFELLKLTLEPTTTSSVIVECNVNESGSLSVYGVNQASNSVYNVISNSILPKGKNQNIQIDISSWLSGRNFLIFQFEDEIYIENFIK